MNDYENFNPLAGTPLGAGRFIIVTGAAGFIGSCMVQFLNENGYENLILVDDFGIEEKRRNWEGKNYEAIVERRSLFDWLKQHEPQVDAVIHLGARTDTTEFDYAIHQELNVEYSQDVWIYCVEKNIPLIYASSAATYGSGDLGYNDDHEVIYKLQPLNPYGVSKNEFDKWAIQQSLAPPFWAGLKFFNVYGPNEYHKERMASVIYHSFNQIKKDGLVKLFRSHRDDFKDGEQLRDFIYVKDVVKVIFWIMEEMGNSKVKSKNSKIESNNEDAAAQTSSLQLATSNLNSGLYNLGTGTSRAFVDLVKATFAGVDKDPNIEYIDMPEDIRDKYQYFTEANMQKLKDAGYEDSFYSLEEGVEDYVRSYLTGNKIY